MQTVATTDPKINARLRRHLDRSLQEAALAITRRHVELGRRIRLARDAKGWKQKQLARATNVEPTTVSRWETGTHAPEMHTLRVIADVLEKPLSYFVTVAEEPLPDPGLPDPGLKAILDHLQSLEAQVSVGFQAVEAAIAELNARLPAQAAVER